MVVRGEVNMGVLERRMMKFISYRAYVRADIITDKGLQFQVEA